MCVQERSKIVDGVRDALVTLEVGFIWEEEERSVGAASTTMTSVRPQRHVGIRDLPKLSLLREFGRDSDRVMEGEAENLVDLLVAAFVEEV